MKLLGIEFAPLDVPLERRLQTVSAAAWFVTMAFGGFIGLFLAVYLLLFWRYWWLVAVYLCWMLTLDRHTAERGGRPWKWVKSWTWWRYNRDYFPLRLERVPFAELDPARNYLLACFPHGVLSCGAFNAFAAAHSDFGALFPRHEPRVATLAQHYSMPFFRELALWMGGVSASPASIDHVLGTPGGGRACVLMVGGAAEAFHCRPGSYKVILKNRKGFVRLALKNGAPIVPVLSFGETDLFDQLEGSTLRNLQERIKRWIGLAPVLPIGRGFFQYSFGIIPRRRPVTTVVGKPLDVPLIENPSKEDVEEYHSKFVKCLTEMFEEQKFNYLENPEQRKLIIS